LGLGRDRAAASSQDRRRRSPFGRAAVASRTSLFSSGKGRAILDALVRVAPSILLEVLSPRPRDARRDRVDKVADYSFARAKYYWLVDPEVRMLEILELGAKGRYTQARVATDGTVRRIPGCPGLVLDLDELWKEIDEADTEVTPARNAAKRRRR
jgi:Uma2 family endonuclease